jgi:hypothetical protein
MKITTAKISGPPEHALTPRDVRRLLEAMPDVWRAEVSKVHLLADLPPKIWASSPELDWVGLAQASLFRSTQNWRAERHVLTGRPGVLRIRCRGAWREDAARAALRAMAAASGHLGPQKLFPIHLTGPERRMLDELVEPYLQTFLQDEQDIAGRTPS